jgi:hypothetical protein
MENPPDSRPGLTEATCLLETVRVQGVDRSPGDPGQLVKEVAERVGERGAGHGI